MVGSTTEIGFGKPESTGVTLNIGSTPDYSTAAGSTMRAEPYFLSLLARTQRWMCSLRILFL